MKKWLFCAAICAAMVSVGAEIVRNGAFKPAADGSPADWIFAASGNADAKIDAVTTDDGSNAVRFVNRSAHAPNVFAMINQFVPVEADAEYKLTGEIRNTGKIALTFCLGRGWATRFQARSEGDKWTAFSFPFKMKPEQLENGKMQLIALIEHPTDGILLRNLAIVPVAEEKKTANAASDNVEISAASPVLNGSFENGPIGGLPDNWNFYTSGEAKAAVTVTDQSACLGGRAIKFTNDSPTSPNVYGALVQYVKLEPDKEYELSVMVRGRNASRLLICIGKPWQIRCSATGIGDEWKKYTYQFKVPADQFESDGRCMLVLITDGLCEEMFVDALSINPAGTRLVGESSFRNERMMTLPEFSGDWKMLKAIPENAEEFDLPCFPQESLSGKLPDPGAFSGKAAFAFNAQGLLFFFRVNDRTAVVKGGENMWRGDSIQVRIDQAGAAAPQPLESDLEFGVAVDEAGKVLTYNWSTSSELPEDGTEFIGFRDAAGYFIAGVLDWKYLSAIGYPEKRFYTFSMLINDAAPEGGRDVYFLTPGIHDGKFANEFFKVLLPEKSAVGGVFPNETTSTASFSGQLLAAGLTDAPLRAVITDGAGKKHTFNLAEKISTPGRSLAAVDYQLPLAEIADGDCSITFLAGDKEIARYSARKADPYKSAVATLDGAVKRFESLRKEAAEFYGDKPYSMYVSLPIAVLDRFLGRLQKGLHGANAADRDAYVERIEMIAPELQDELDRLEGTLAKLRNGETLPETWQTVGDADIVLNDGWPSMMQRSNTGREEVRPVLFSGYGHFGNMLSDLPNFPAFGANIIQIEMGPRSLFPTEGKTQEFEPDFSGFDGTKKMLDAARAAGLKVCFLISPHYAPQWWREKHPEALLSTGFMPYDIAAPEARKLNSAFIRAFLPVLKENYGDVIHSICLLNEPIYNAGLNEESVKTAFTAYLEKKFGSIAALNKTLNREYADFAAAVAAQGSDRAVNAEFIRYRRGVLSDFARFLAAEVRAVWPEIPVHAKIMMTSSTFADHGVDAESFASFSDYNGNDNYFNYREGGYASDWVTTALGHEIQVSMQPLSIMNTENHIIRDSERRPIPGDQIYTANFQQFISGASGLVTWVWVDYLPEGRRGVNRDLSGNIAIRPGNVIAHGRVSLDALRLAPEITAFARAKSEIGIIFSLNTLAYQMDSYRSALFDFYAQAAFTGHRVRFISESQLEKGDFGELKMIFAVGASHLSNKAAEALARFPGKVVVDSFSLISDENDQPLKFDRSAVEQLPKFIKAAELKNRFLDPVVALPVGIEPVSEGVYFREVPDGKGGWLINLVNYNTSTRNFKLTGNGSFHDLIADKALDTAEFELQPLQPQLLRFTPEK